MKEIIVLIFNIHKILNISTFFKKILKKKETNLFKMRRYIVNVVNERKIGGQIEIIDENGRDNISGGMVAAGRCVWDCH